MALEAQSNVVGLASVFREPPQNNEAEQALLGAILANNTAFHRVSEILLSEHFADSVHGRIYAAISTLIDRGHAATPVSLKNLFDQDGALAEIGGSAYLARLAAAVVTIINAPDYARTIYETYLRRRLISIGEDVVNDAHTFTLNVSAERLIEDVEAQLFELAERRSDAKGVTLAQSAAAQIGIIEEIYKNGGALRGITTGLTDLDARLGGLVPGRVYVLGARTSMGKTALALGIAYETAVAGNPTMLFELEMPHADLTARLFARLTGISTNDQDSGHLTSNDFDRLMKAQHHLSEVPLYIDDDGSVTLSQIRARARRLMRKVPLGLIVIDYIQLIRGGDDGRRGENRVQEISEITRGLKALAKELDVPILALSQLSRRIEEREDKRPLLSDLRESGSIEQDADVVMFLYRHEYYLDREPPIQRPNESDEKFADRVDVHERQLSQSRGLAEIIIAKSRQGRIGTVKTRFDGVRQRFSAWRSEGEL